VKILLFLLLLNTPVPETIRFTSAGDTLEGDLILPAGTAQAPLVVFVHGSGQRTRRDYDYIARTLNEAGYATFQYDKRGVAKSGGTFVEVGTWNSLERIRLLASDAASAITTLRNHKRIDPKRVTVMGGSQAGWIIPVVAGLVDVSSTVMISGPTVSVGEEIYYSDLAEMGSHSQEDADKMLRNFKGPRGFDNIVYVSRMKNPSLWLFGGKDVSIPVKKCISRLDSVKAAARIPVTLKIYPDGDHGIFNHTTNQMENYIPLIVEWLKAI
jgi:dipeptidyl aminopeptidase/acylaminoacyl peptidase